MQVKKSVKKKKVDTVELSDELGFEYESARERAKAASEAQNVLSERIKSVAKEVGEWSGDRCTISGRRFTVGFMVTKPKSAVDWTSFAKKHPAIFSKLVSQQVDEAKVEAALQNGLLPRKLLLKYVVPVGEPSNRLVVSRIGESNEDNTD